MKKTILITLIATIFGSSAFANLNADIKINQAILLGSSICRTLATKYGAFYTGDCIKAEATSLISVANGDQVTVAEFITSVCSQIDYPFPKSTCLEQGLKSANDYESMHALESCPATPSFDVQVKAMSLRNDCTLQILNPATK